MDAVNPVDNEIRAWLKRHVTNESQLSVAVGHSPSWLHKYINGQGHATIDDLIKIAAVLFGVNLPALTETEQKLLKACRSLEESDQHDVLAYAEHRQRLARRAQSKESSEPAEDTPPATARKVRGKR